MKKMNQKKEHYQVVLASTIFESINVTGGRKNATSIEVDGGYHENYY